MRFLLRLMGAVMLFMYEVLPQGYVWHTETPEIKPDGQDYEAIAAAYEAQGKVCVMTYIYHAGSEKAYDEVMGSIRSLEFRDRD